MTIINDLYNTAYSELDSGTLDVSNLGIAIMDQSSIFDPVHSDYNNAGVVLQEIDIQGSLSIESNKSTLDIDDFVVIGISVDTIIG